LGDGACVCDDQRASPPDVAEAGGDLHVDLEKTSIEKVTASV